MWTVIITEIIREEGTVIVRAVLTDNKTKIPKEYRVSTELELKTKINSDIANLSVAEVEFPKLATGVYDPTILSTVSTPEDLARTQYAINLNTYRSMKRAIDVGVKTDADADYAVLGKTLKQDFLDTYVDLF